MTDARVSFPSINRLIQQQPPPTLFRGSRDQKHVQYVPKRLVLITPDVISLVSLSRPLPFVPNLLLQVARPTRRRFFFLDCHSELIEGKPRCTGWDFRGMDSPFFRNNEGGVKKKTLAVKNGQVGLFSSSRITAAAEP
jgi:hypothetical protein